MASDTAEKRIALALGPVALAVLYVSGFFVYFGESHLLGLNLPVASQIEYLVLGGDFLFQSLQAVLRPLLAPGSAPWLGTLRLSQYLVVLLALAALLGAARLLRRWKRTRDVVHLDSFLRGLDVAAAVTFAVTWMLVLVEAFAYRDLLFPLRPETVAEERGHFTRLTAPAEHLTASQVAVQRGHYQKRALARELEARTDARGDDFGRRLREWRAWREATPESKSLAFGLVILITLGSLALLFLAFRGTRSFRPPLRHLVLGFLGLLALFQVCLLPLTYGIALKRRDFPVVRVNESKVSDLEGQTALYLGEADKRVYLYQDDALWTLHVVASGAIGGWQIEGRKTALAWIDELVELPARKDSQ